MKVQMTENMRESISKFLKEKTIQDVDRNTYLIHNLNDSANKITISLVFMRDSGNSMEITEYGLIKLAGKGAVFIFHPYWISVPVQLSVPYVESIIDEFYDTDVSEWVGGEENNPNFGSCPCNLI